jgi:hypothetical protein
MAPKGRHQQATSSQRRRTRRGLEEAPLAFLRQRPPSSCAGGGINGALLRTAQELSCKVEGVSSVQGSAQPQCWAGTEHAAADPAQPRITRGTF